MLEAHGLSKSYRGKPALHDLTFTVARGEIHGLLGHNGAGKSTTLGIILGMIAPTGGDVRINGRSVRNDRRAALRHVGAIFESPAFYDYLSGWDNLRVLCSYSGGFQPAAAREAVERVGLTSRIHSKVGSYSHGMRQRLALAQALLPEPDLLLLDEPTDGLDPEGIKWFRDFILDLRATRGTTILFNSHLLAEVEQMCDRVTILRDGRLVRACSIASLADGPPVFATDIRPWPAAAPVLAAHGATVLADQQISLPEDRDPADLVAALAAAGLRVRAFAPVRRTLEDFYLQLQSPAPHP